MKVVTDSVLSLSSASTDGASQTLVEHPSLVVNILLGQLWSSTSSSCSPEFESCDPLHSGALVSRGSLQFGNQSYLTYYIFFMPGISQTITKMLSFSRFSTAVAEQTFPGSDEQVRDRNKLNVPQLQCLRLAHEATQYIAGHYYWSSHGFLLGILPKNRSVLILFITFNFL